MLTAHACLVLVLPLQGFLRKLLTSARLSEEHTRLGSITHRRGIHNKSQAGSMHFLDQHTFHYVNTVFPLVNIFWKHMKTGGLLGREEGDLGTQRVKKQNRDTRLWSKCNTRTHEDAIMTATHIAELPATKATDLGNTFPSTGKFSSYVTVTWSSGWPLNSDLAASTSRVLGMRASFSTASPLNAGDGSQGFWHTRWTLPTELKPRDPKQASQN